MTDKIELDISKFRELFPAFSDQSKYPTVTIEMKWEVATCYISDLDCGRLKSSCRQYAIFLMMAHLLYIDDCISAGIKLNPTTSVSEGKVSASFAAFPSEGSWDFWLGQSSYGQQLVALLSSVAAGGYYVGGSNVTAGFRGVGGYFERY